MVQYSSNPNLYNNPSGSILFLIYDLLYADLIPLFLQSDTQIYNRSIIEILLSLDPPQFSTLKIHVGINY